MALERRASSEDQAKRQPPNETVRKHDSRSSATKKRAVHSGNPPSQTDQHRRARIQILLGCDGDHKLRCIDDAHYLTDFLLMLADRSSLERMPCSDL